MAHYNENKHGLNSLQIRIIAIISMAASLFFVSGIYYDANLSDCAKWFSFTLFAFLLVEGINNTTDRMLYLRRFIFFTAISEVAYDFYLYNTYWDIRQQSIMLTLLISLIIFLICDYFKRRFKNSVVNITLIIGLTVGAIKLARFLKCDFAEYGILLVMLFYASYDLTYSKLFEIAAMGYYAYTQDTSTAFTVFFRGLRYEIPIVIIAVFALIITWTYNEHRGKNNVGLKILLYLAYPVLLLIFKFL